MVMSTNDVINLNLRVKMVKAMWSLANGHTITTSVYVNTSGYHLWNISLSERKKACGNSTLGGKSSYSGSTKNWHTLNFWEKIVCVYKHPVSVCKTGSVGSIWVKIFLTAKCRWTWWFHSLNYLSASNDDIALFHIHYFII